MKRVAIIFLQAVIVLTGMVALVALIWEPRTEGVNAHATNFEIYFKDPFLALVYVGAIPFFVALYQAFRILGKVAPNEFSSQEIIRRLHLIKYCAVAIIGFVAIEEFIILLHHGSDDPAGGVFMGFLITFGSAIAIAVTIVLEKMINKR